MKNPAPHCILPTAVAVVIAISLSLGHYSPAKDQNSNDEAKDGKHRAAIAQLLAGPIQRLDFEIKKDDLESLRKEPRRYVEAEFRSGGKVYKGVAVKLKGADGSFEPIDA